MSSIYITTVSELAKKNGFPTGEFIAKLREVGFVLPENAAHLKRLSQEDLDNIAKLLNPGQVEEQKEIATLPQDFVVPECASIVITKVSERDFVLSAVVSTIVNGNLVVKELERIGGMRSKSEALLESDKLSYKYRTDTSL